MGGSATPRADRERASVRPLIVAIGFLTTLRVPQVRADAADFAAAIRFYPIVGALIGAVVMAAVWLGARVDPWAGALLGVVAWSAITGALHLDGLGDVADGLGAAHGDRSRLIAVMADPHIGSFGVVTIVLQLAAKLVLLRLLVEQPYTIAAIPFAARIGPMVWARLLAPLKPGGLGAMVASAVRLRDLIGWGGVLAAVALLAPAMVLAPVLILAFAGWARARMGGVTGDVHGAGIELVETGLLASAVVLGLLG